MISLEKTIIIGFFIFLGLLGMAFINSTIEGVLESIGGELNKCQATSKKLRAKISRQEKVIIKHELGVK